MHKKLFLLSIILCSLAKTNGMEKAPATAAEKISSYEKREIKYTRTLQTTIANIIDENSKNLDAEVMLQLSLMEGIFAATNTSSPLLTQKTHEITANNRILNLYELAFGKYKFACENGALVKKLAEEKKVTEEQLTSYILNSVLLGGLLEEIQKRSPRNFYS
jgi:hypothetical protein